MNCKQGDLAIVRTTHPYTYLHGALVECVSYEPAVMSHFGKVEVDVWNIKFLGTPKLSDDGLNTQEGWIPDRYLRPVRGEPETQDHDEEITA